MGVDKKTLAKRAARKAIEERIKGMDSFQSTEFGNVRVYEKDHEDGVELIWVRYAGGSHTKIIREEFLPDSIVA